MKLSGITARLGLAGVCAASVCGGVAAAAIAVPTAAAAPDCSPAALTNTVSSTWGSARQYLKEHPGANQVMMAAMNQSRPQASADVRAYFTAHPQEYYDLRGILAPIGDAQHQCNATVLPSDLASAYTEFMAG
jgi:hemophore-related protein